MGREYCFSLDLGSDSMKIACAFLDENGKETVMKVVDPRYSEIAVPAVACYDQDRGKWLFGYEVGRSNEKSYATVVKIKDLLGIITLSGAYYSGCSRFPLFEFPITNSVPESYYREYKAGGRVRASSPYDKYFFAAPGTPQSVCEQYFAYVVKVMARFMDKVFHERLYAVRTASYTLVVPPKSNAVFVSELQRLVRKAFFDAGSHVDEDQVKTQSSAKVLGMLAIYFDDDFGLKPETESALIFDIGEERISVVKFTKLVRGRGASFNIDGVTGHSLPEKLGGNDIDKALVDEIERQIIGLGAMGTGDAGSADHLHEKGSRANNYLFMKSVKAAKVILGREFRRGAETDYPDGVPVSIIRDVDIYQNITQQEFAKSIGINPSGRTCVSGSVAYRIGKYVQDELVKYRSTNSNADTVYLSGGAAGTAGLAEFLQAVVSKTDSRKKVKTLEDFFKAGGSETAYSVKGTDIYSYGPAVGAAFAALRKDKIMVCLTKSYGTIAYLGSTKSGSSVNRRFYSIIANMGSVLDFEKCTMQRCSGEGKERYVKGPDGKVLYKEYSQTYFLSNAESDAIFIYSSALTDSSVFPDDAEVPEDVQKLYKDRTHSADFSSDQISYFAKNSNEQSGISTVHDRSRGRVYLALPAGSGEPIRKELYSVLESELGFKLEGGGNDEKVCMWYRSRSQLVTAITIHDLGESQYDKRKKVYFVDVGVRIDSEGMAETFARMTENKTGDSSNRGKTFDITYQTALGSTSHAYRVQPDELIVDFNRKISVDTGESLH